MESDHSSLYILLLVKIFMCVPEVNCLLVSVNSPTTVILDETSFELICTYSLEPGDFLSPYAISWKKETSVNVYTTIANFSPYGPTQPAPTFSSILKSEYGSRSILTNPTPAMMQAKLKVHEAKCSDEGLYRCVVQYTNPKGGGSPYAETEVKIHSKAQIPYEVPSMHPATNIEEGQKVQFNCTANVGKPAGQILWWKFRRNSTAPSSLTSASQTFTAGDCYFNVTSTLTITMTKDEDCTVIRCSVNQSLLTGPDSEKPHRNSRRIIVYYKIRTPVITRIPHLPEYAVGTEVVLECTASGRPNPGCFGVDNNINKYVWSYKSFDGSKITQIPSVNGVVTLTDIQPEDAGVYTCVAHNGFNGKNFQEDTSIRLTIDPLPSCATTPSLEYNSLHYYLFCYNLFKYIDIYNDSPCRKKRLAKIIL